MISRRGFITTAALGTASLAVGLEAQEKPPAAPKTEGAGVPAAAKPVLISKSTGKQSMEVARQMLLDGADTLDAVIHVCQVQEDDPDDDSVGLGGLPNEEGVVELDASCMHGPTRRGGAVGGVREIKHVALLARAVTEHTAHVMLVGEGAQRFGAAMGFPRENLLTERSRRIWLLWKETMSDRDWWGPGLGDPDWKPPVSAQPPGTAEMWRLRRKKVEEMAADLGIPPLERPHAVECVLLPPTGTIHCSAVNARGEMSGATTTCGLAWKLPGRVGDSAILGAGCYTDQEVGSAGATGSGEQNILVGGARSIVENMRGGMSPKEAGLDVLRRLVRLYRGDMTRVKFIDMVYYILRRDGAYAGVSLWSHGPSRKRHQFAVNDGTQSLEDTVALLEGSGIDWPPVPVLPDDKRTSGYGK